MKQLTRINVLSDLPPASATGSVLRLIGTHCDTFHCDEALACSILTSLPEYKDATIIRTRNREKLAKCDIVVDVGDVYDAQRLRFDHHQRGFCEILSEEGFSTKLSSAGLVYKHFGREFIQEVLGDRLPHEVVNSIIFKKVYRGYIEAVDAKDNGIDEYDGSRRYQDSTGISARVSRLNPNWREDSSDDARNESFKKAMALTLGEIIEHIHLVTESWWPARSIVQHAIAVAKVEAHQSGMVVILDQFCPWQSHLHELEKEQGIEGHIKFILFPNGDPKLDPWRVRAINVADGSYELRMPLAEQWCGIRNEELIAKCGIPGSTFVHANGFIGENKTKLGALRMAVETLEGSSSAVFTPQEQQ
eukprot:284197_1